MQKRLTLSVATVTLLLVAFVISGVSAAYSVSIIYTKFNSLNWIDYALDQSYSGLTADVRTKLTFGGTPGVSAKIAFANGTTGTPTGVNLIFGDDESTLTVYYNQGPDEVLIGSGTYTNDGNSTTRVILSGGKLSVYTHYGVKASQAKIVDGFNFNEPIAFLRVKGTDVNTTTNGYAQVNINVGTAGTTAIVTSFIPIIVLFAMLGMVLGMLKKFGKL